MNKKIIIYSTIVITLASVTVISLNNDFSVNGIIATVGESIRNDTDTQKISARSSSEKLKSIQINNIDSLGMFSHVSSLSTKDKIMFLMELYKTTNKNENNANDYINNIAALSATLSLLALDNDESVSEQSLRVINYLAIATHSTNKSSIDLQDFTKSKNIKESLEYLFIGSDSNDDIKSLAIDAYSWLYLPDNSIISEFEKIIVRGDSNQAGTLSAIFGAFSKYKTLYNYDMPASILEASEKLIEHPSDSVKSDAISQLSKNVGKSFLPVLFDQLRITRSLSVVDTIVVNILLSDQSDETVRQLKEIAAKSPGSGKEMIIKRYTRQKNIEHFMEVGGS